ncbi:MAG: Tol-Pal system beta propeller repeat protein TolB [Betaproteobacteria bacterium]|nr:Tol-Pal system beta propeller repeat protein TolB [Betaproteobacteria bacterium]
MKDTLTHRLFRTLLIGAALALSGAAHAALTIEIIGAGANQIPIAIVPFRAEEGLPQQITSVVAADLTRSGLFRMVDPGGIVPVPHQPEQLNYPQWQARGAEAVVIGTVAAQPGGRYEVRFRVMDVVKQTQLAGFAFSVASAQLRLTAHRIADIVYEKLTGDVGVFSTRITYVVKRGEFYELQVADADGYNPQTVLASNEPIISPSWAPDGQRIAYVSFERKKPVVYVQSLTTGGRKAVANHWGSNSAPSWSPDGRRLAVTLTKDGGSHIYLINADGSGEPVRLTSGSAINTEPNFSPDGQLLLFTSDRGGSPQIYGMSINGADARRLTFDGTYNVSPRFSPDGKNFTFIQRSGNHFSIAVQDLATRQVQLLTQGGIDESPSYAPNGRLILYATVISGRGILAAVSSDGRVKQRLTEYTGDVREPAWGPLIK